MSRSPLPVLFWYRGLGGCLSWYRGPGRCLSITLACTFILPAGWWEEIKSGVKEEVSAHRERRQAPVLSRAEPHCLRGPGLPCAGRGRLDRSACWRHRPLWAPQPPAWPAATFPGDVPDSACFGSCLCDCLFPLVTAVSPGLWVSGLPSMYVSEHVILLF